MKKLAVAVGILFLAAFGWHLAGNSNNAVHPTIDKKVVAAHEKPVHRQIIPLAASSAQTGPASPAKGKEGPAAKVEQAEIERCKKIDIEHMTRLYKGIMAYLKKNGRYPEQLSQLVPEFVSADALRSPMRKLDTSNAFFASEHADPGVSKPSYAFEFSNIEYRDGRTFAEIKEIQRTEWGDVVPMLRSFAYDKAINVSCRGDVYETQLNWEWDTATLDLAEKYGWGSGLADGEMVRVRALRADGTPAAGAQVWADGRNYSFDLPNRPFTADAQGWVTIPIGADVDRTALVLRAEAPGFVSPTLRSDPGQLPQNQSLALEPAQRIGGIAVGPDGSPLPGARVFLGQASPSGTEGTPHGSPTISVVADAQGRWSAEVHPTELAGLAAKIGRPGGTPFKYTGTGIPLDKTAALAGKAVVRVAKP